jgi:hypothetical protein
MKAYIKTTGKYMAPQGNDRERPVADFANCIINTETTPIEYCRKITLQPEDFVTR